MNRVSRTLNINDATNNIQINYFEIVRIVNKDVSISTQKNEREENKTKNPWKNISNSK